MFAEWLNEDSGQSSKACLRQKSEDLNSHLECAGTWLDVQFCVLSSVLWNWHGRAWLLRRVWRKDSCQHHLVVGETCKLFSSSPDPGNWSLWVRSPKMYVLTSSLGDSDSRFSSSYPCLTDLRIHLERFFKAGMPETLDSPSSLSWAVLVSGLAAGISHLPQDTLHADKFYCSALPGLNLSEIALTLSVHQRAIHSAERE